MRALILKLFKGVPEEAEVKKMNIPRHLKKDLISKTKDD